jgi:hypothetical protein
VLLEKQGHERGIVDCSIRPCVTEWSRKASGFVVGNLELQEHLIVCLRVGRKKQGIISLPSVY